MINVAQKMTIRVLIRRAIKKLNSQFMFSCFDCICCVPRGDDIPGHACSAEVVAFPNRKRTSAHLMPPCFSYNYMDSPLADVLEAMHAMGVDFHEAKQGWPTIVARLLPRLSQHGHNMNIKPKNLERWK